MEQRSVSSTLLQVWAEVARCISDGGAQQFIGRLKETMVLRRVRAELECIDPSLTIVGPDMQERFDQWGIDLVVGRGSHRTAVEGKFKVVTDGAIPGNRKAAFFDLYKLEQYVSSGQYASGLFLWLTNERRYLMPATGESADFSVHQGRVYTAGTALHAKRARNAGMPLPLTLTHDYTFTWRTIGCGSSWFSLTLEVPKGAG